MYAADRYLTVPSKFMALDKNRGDFRKSERSEGHVRIV